MPFPSVFLTDDRLRFFLCDLGWTRKDIEVITGWSRADINRAIHQHKLRKASGLYRDLGIPELDVIAARLDAPLSFHEGVSLRAAREELRDRLMESARRATLHFTALDLLIRDVHEMVRERQQQRREPGVLLAEAADRVLRLLEYPLTEEAKERLRVLHDRLHDLEEGGAFGAQVKEGEPA